MDIVWFLLVGIGLYFVSDWLLRLAERLRGAPFGTTRSVVFFAIFLTLALISFQLIQRLSGGAG